MKTVLMKNVKIKFFKNYTIILLLTLVIIISIAFIIGAILKGNYFTIPICLILPFCLLYFFRPLLIYFDSNGFKFFKPINLFSDYFLYEDIYEILWIGSEYDGYILVKYSNSNKNKIAKFYSSDRYYLCEVLNFIKESVDIECFVFESFEITEITYDNNNFNF